MSMSDDQVFPPRMGPRVVQETPSVWRVTDVEIDEIVWAVPLLQRQWPRLTEDQCGHWFKAALNDRYTMFVRTKNCLGMAHYDSSTKEPLLVVKEDFIRGKDGYDPSEPLLIHKRFLDWATGLNAKEYQYKHDSDRVGTTGQIKEMFRKNPKVIGVEEASYQVATLRE